MTTGVLLLRLLDWTLLVVHGSLVIFNVSGWAWRRTRRLHLVVVSGTVASWFGLGAAYGWGYCPLTDWHWQVKVALGETGLPASWVKHYLDVLTGATWDPAVVDAFVGATGAGALALAATLAVRDRSTARAAEHPVAPGLRVTGPRSAGLRPRTRRGKVKERRAASAAPTSDTEEA